MSGMNFSNAVLSNIGGGTVPIPQASMIAAAPGLNLSNIGLNDNGSVMPNMWDAQTQALQQLGGNGTTAAGNGLGFNLGTLNMGVNALAAVGGLYNAFQSNKLAKEQFAFTKEVTNTNLNNQIKTYNTTLEDRALARGRLNGDTDPAAYATAYTDKNKISRG